MIKDYVPIQEGMNDVQEIDFVESWWTEKLSGPENSFQEINLTGRDQFRILKSYLDKLPGGIKILDGGCGRGEWTVYLSKLGYDVTGLDISGELISKLKKVFPEYNFVQGDLRSTDFEENTFDVYFSWGAFEHFEGGLSPCLKEAFRILKPGGHLLITVPFANNRHLRKLKYSLVSNDPHYNGVKGYTQPMRFYQWRLTKGELERELEICRFRTQKIIPIHKLEGLHRMLIHDFHLKPRSFLFRFLLKVFLPIVPSNYISHMIMGIAKNIGIVPIDPKKTTPSLGFNLNPDRVVCSTLVA